MYLNYPLPSSTSFSIKDKKNWPDNAQSCKKGEKRQIINHRKWDEIEKQKMEAFWPGLTGEKHSMMITGTDLPAIHASCKKEYSGIELLQRTTITHDQG